MDLISMSKNRPNDSDTEIEEVAASTRELISGIVVSFQCQNVRSHAVMRFRRCDRGRSQIDTT